MQRTLILTKLKTYAPENDAVKAQIDLKTFVRMQEIKCVMLKIFWLRTPKPFVSYVSPPVWTLCGHTNKAYTLAFRPV